VHLQQEPPRVGMVERAAALAPVAALALGGHLHARERAERWQAGWVRLRLQVAVGCGLRVAGCGCRAEIASSASMRSMARLMRSAAEPWHIVLTTCRSARARSARPLALMCGRKRFRPPSVSTKPTRRAACSRSSTSSCTQS